MHDVVQVVTEQKKCTKPVIIIPKMNNCIMISTKPTNATRLRPQGDWATRIVNTTWPANIHIEANITTWRSEKALAHISCLVSTAV
jgi:hypothetical protein